MVFNSWKTYLPYLGALWDLGPWTCAYV